MATYRSLFAAGLILFTACQSKPDSSTLRLKLLVETQRRANNELLKADENMLKGIGYAVESGRYQPQEVAVFKRAEAVLKRTKSLISRLRRIQFAISRHLEQGRDIPALNEREPVASVMSNSRSATSADSLFHNLASFVEFVKPLTSHPIEALWLVEDGTSPLSASQIFTTPESYRKFYFEDATVIETLAVLS